MMCNTPTSTALVHLSISILTTVQALSTKTDIDWNHSALLSDVTVDECHSKTCQAKIYKRNSTVRLRGKSLTSSNTRLQTHTVCLRWKCKVTLLQINTLYPLSQCHRKALLWCVTSFSVLYSYRQYLKKRRQNTEFDLIWQKCEYFVWLVITR